MGALDTLQNGITDIKEFVAEHPLGTAIGAGIVGAGVVGGVIAISGKKTKGKTRKSRKKITHTKRGWKQDRKRRSKQSWEVAYQKRKRKKHSSKKRKGVHYTKKGQPYIIMSSGKARFIKKTKRRTR